MKPEMKKLIIANLPYLLFVYLFGKLGQAYRLAEGIDLSGEKLIGALVAGTGLPQISDERELLRRFYEEKGENGFDYAYRFPGMNKVLQSAGRVIRTTEDRGVIALLDDRFCSREYRALFPREWSDAAVVTLRELPDILREFWDRAQE